jgi:hypothetical protein
MKEAPVEKRLKARLEAGGFKVLKLETPGTIGVPDRMILRPHYSPGAPFFVECKAPDKPLRVIQERIAEDWSKRGIQVLTVCDSYDRVDEICDMLFALIDTETKPK